MRRRARIIAAAALLAACQTGSSLDSTEVEVPPCGSANAERADIAAIAKAPETYNARCVRVSGISSGFMLYADVDGIYRASTDYSNPSSNGGRLGLDSPREIRWTGYKSATIVGRVQLCEDARAITESLSVNGDIYLTTGYCHSYDGPYIWIERVERQATARYERKLERDAGPGYGNLQHAPDRWPPRQRIESLAADFVTALEKRDAQALAVMHSDGPNVYRPGLEAAALLLSRRSPFREVAARPVPQTIVLVERDPEIPDRTADPPEEIFATICFCREADCTGRWPIASWDADNLNSRPYACTTVARYVSGNIVFDTPMDVTGLAEPR